MTNQEWLENLDAALSSLSKNDRTRILHDVREIAAEHQDARLDEILGDPASYASQAMDVFASDPDSAAFQAKLGPAPVEFRGATSPLVRSRIWDPNNPAILTSHLFGIGWSVNLGAVAVKLRLLRPDDYDDVTIAAIPPVVTSVSRAIPTIAAVTTIGLNVGQLARGQKTSVSRKVLNTTLACTAIAWNHRAEPNSEDALIRNALASGATIVALTDTAATARNAKPGLAAAFTAAMIVFLQLLLPVRAGLNQLWKGKR